MLWVPWFLSYTFFVTSLGELSSESMWLQQTVNSPLTREYQNGDSTKPDFTLGSLPNAGEFQTNHHNTSMLRPIGHK